MTFQQGDKPTVSRGKLRGQEVSVTAGPDGNDSYVVTAPDGNFYTIPASNLKAPAEPALTRAALAEKIQHAIDSIVNQTTGRERLDGIAMVLDRLEPDLPGITSQISWRD